MASASCDRPKSLQRLVCDVKYPNGNYLIHQFVVALSKCDQPSNSHIEGCIRYALRSFLRVEVNARRNEGGFTALHLAVMKRDSFMVKMLLSCLPTVDVNATCENGKKGTALHLATAGYYFKSVCPKRRFAKYKRNNTQLDKAAKEEDNLETVKVLLEYGANIDAHDDITFTALHYSVMHKRMDMLKLLISKGANVNVENDHSRTPLHEAARHGSLEAVNILLESGANVDAVDGTGSTALHYAALRNDIDIMKLLISKSMNVSIRNLGGFTPIMSAIQCVSLYDQYGESPLYDIHDQIELVKLFINKGAELNVKTIYGTTPLHAAVKSRCLKTVKILVESGASVDAEDNYGDTALRIAEGHKFNEIVEYLNCQLAIVKAVDRDDRILVSEGVCMNATESGQPPI